MLAIASKPSLTLVHPFEFFSNDPVIRGLLREVRPMLMESICRFEGLRIEFGPVSEHDL